MPAPSSAVRNVAEELVKAWTSRGRPGLPMAMMATVLLVPSSALFREGDGWAVYTMRDGKAHKVTVELGLENPDFAEVRSGLAEGDEVIVHPGDTIREGVMVATRE